MDKSPKSKEEWKKLINEKLTPGEFQNLSYDLLISNGFINVKQRGKGGDGGRDLQGEHISTIVKDKLVEKYWFQCKKVKKGVNFKNISTEIQKAEQKGINKFVVLSNTEITSVCMDDIDEWNKTKRCHVLNWSGSTFLELLFELPDICQRYFPDEEIPKIINVKNPEEIIPLSKKLGNRFGIEIEINTKDIDPTNPKEVGEKLKQSLLKLNIDLNLKALIYEKSSMFFFSISQADTAILFLDKSLEITPKNLNALLSKGYILEKLDQLPDSTKVYEKIIGIDPKNIFALNNKGSNLMRGGELEESLEYFERVLVIDPTFMPSIKNKVSILKKLKKLDSAKDFLEKKKKLFEKSINLMEEYVDIFIEELDLKRAFEINEKLLEKDPNNITALNNKGVIYERNARFQLAEKYYPLALECFEEVTKKRKDFVLGLSNKVAVLMKKRDLTDAKNFLLEASTKFPDSAEILNNKGILFLQNKKFKEAKKQFILALKKYYKGNFLLNLANSKFKLRDYEGCLKDIEKILGYEQKNSSAWALKAECLKKLRRGNHKKCLKNAREFIERPISLLE